MHVLYVRILVPLLTSSPFPSLQLTLFDSKTHRLLRSFPLPASEWSSVRLGMDTGQVFATLDRDTLIARVQSSVKTTAFIFKLREVFDGEEEGLVQWKCPIAPRARRRRRRMLPVEEARALRRRTTWNEPFRGQEEEEELSDSD